MKNILKRKKINRSYIKIDVDVVDLHSVTICELCFQLYPTNLLVVLAILIRYLSEMISIQLLQSYCCPRRFFNVVLTFIWWMSSECQDIWKMLWKMQRYLKNYCSREIRKQFELVKVEVIEILSSWKLSRFHFTSTLI